MSSFTTLSIATFSFTMSSSCPGALGLVIHGFRGLRSIRRGMTIVIVLMVGWTSHASDPDPHTLGAGDPETVEWIRQLGADEFAMREAAQRKLIEAGPTVYDQVQSATTSSDLEVRGRASFILQQLRHQVAWVSDDAPPRVRSILQDYDLISELGREVRVILLSDVVYEGGARPLCQIARYDSSQRVAKDAALTLIEAFQQGGLAPDDGIGEQLVQMLHGSQRSSVIWLRDYLNYLHDGRWDAMPVAQWRRSEAQLLVDKSPDTDFDLAFRLATSLVPPTDDQSSQAAAAVMRLVSLDAQVTEERLIQSVDWLVRQQQYEFAWEALKQHAGRLGNGLNLACRMADVQWHVGDRRAATDMAAQTKSRDQQSMEDHLNVARYYSRRGHHDWANAEYQQLMDLAGEKTSLNIWVRSLRAELLHDQEQELEAAEMLEPAVAWIDQDKELRKQVDLEGPRTADHIKSRWQFFNALHDGQQQDFTSAREKLAEAVENNPLDADVIIAMYDLSDADAEWAKKVRARIDQAMAQFHLEIQQGKKELKQLEMSLSRFQNESANIQQARLALYLRARKLLATYNNQWAWLVSNTEGDFDESLRLIREAVRLSPHDAGLLDTLGRCYFATGDLDSAIKYQKQAAALEPFSRQIARQLESFQASAAEQARSNGDD